MQDFEFPVTVADSVATLDLNRPEEGNALTRPMIETLAATIRRLAADEQTRLIVLKARGELFCRGRDGRGEAAFKSPHERLTKAMGPVLAVYEAIGSAPVPIVALVQGPAVGFGAALAGACDITLSSDAASFAFTEILHDIPPTMAMAAVLRNVPPKALAYLIYSAEKVSAAQAQEVGLVSKVYPSAEFEAAGAAFIATLAVRPRVILETIKKFQRHATGARQELVAEYAGTLLAVVRS